ncbi:MAG: phage integrase family protein [Planctomycetes bacterium]|nr:phage integrase family protein [Planctomycetota bacterium]
MTRSHSTRPPMPAKPSPDFPLTPHRNGRWCKKIRGKIRYFGRWDDPDGALAEYLEQKDRLQEGLTTADNRDGLTVHLLCGKFLTTKKRMMESDELSVHTFADYARVCKLLCKTFGNTRLVADLRPDDFEKLRGKMAKRLGPVKLGNEINRIRVVFNYAYKSDLIVNPMKYGEGFRRPSKKTLRKNRQSQVAKMFTADEIRAMLDAAGQPLHAMILLGVNCGFGNSDLGTLPIAALDLQRGWLDYPRPKTAIARRAPLWPETVAALRDWLRVRPEPKNPQHAGLVFITARSDSWAKNTSDNPLSKETRKLLDRLKIEGHRNFYCLRHTLQTIGDEARDFLAVRHIMGHAGSDIADEYREKVSDERLLGVTDFVRAWLFAKDEADGGDVLPFARAHANG